MGMAFKFDLKHKKIKLANLIIIILLLIIIALALFGWFYRQGLDPVPRLTPGFMQSTSSAPKYLFTISGGSAGGLHKPLAVAVDQNGRIFVADTGDGVIKAFDPNGKYLSEFGAAQLQDPFQLTYAQNRLWVADPTLRKVQVFNTDGKFLKTFVQSPAQTGKKVEYLTPTAVAVAKSGEVYVADTATQTVRVYDAEGRELRRFGHPGNDNGGLMYPNALWVAGDKVFVSDSNNARIQVFDLQGAFLQTIGGGPNRAGGLTLPRGITVSPSGQVLVVDVFTQVVRAFDQQGKLVWSLGETGQNTDDNQGFNFPNGIWLDNSGKLYVTDRENNRVQVFKF